MVYDHWTLAFACLMCARRIYLPEKPLQPVPGREKREYSYASQEQKEWARKAYAEGMTQHAIALELGCSQAAVHFWIAGRKKESKP